jgi:hypothetical protein
VEGTVTWDSNGEALNGAQVIVFTLEKIEGVSGVDVYQTGSPIQTLQTDENGKFTTTLEPDAYTIQIWLLGQKVADRMVEVKSGKQMTVDISVTSQSP